MIPSNIPQPEDVRDHVRCSFDPNASIGAGSAVVREAGAGDVAALRQLLDLSIANLWRCPANAPRALIMAAEAVAFGRLCASHRERRDIRKLAGALCMASDQARQIGYTTAADGMMGESIAILERLASEGDDLAATASCQLVTDYPASVEIAKALLSGTEE